MNILYETQTMLAAITLLSKRKTFLRDRYFPCNEKVDIFPTEDVLVEYKSGSKILAPCVLPRKGGITIERDGYKTQRYTPPQVAPQRSLTIDQLNKKGFGENLFSNITPEQRQADILRQDMLDLDDMISGREEYIAAQAMLNNGYTLRHYADKYGTDEFEEFEMRFYDGSDNPTKYTPSVDWNEPTADILSDIRAMAQMLSSRGLPATDLIVSSDVAEALINNVKIQSMFDNRNMQMGNIAPAELPDGATFIGKINAYGKVVDVYSYDETYEDEITGKTMQYIPNGQVILTAPAAGRCLYGAVTQIEQDDNEIHTYMGKRVPKYLADAYTDIKQLRVTAKPLLIPLNLNPWINSTVIGG